MGRSTISNLGVPTTWSRGDFYSNEKPPEAPSGYSYRYLGGNMYCVDLETGKRVAQTMFLIPDSWCLFDATFEYSLPGVQNARASGDWTCRIQVCGCSKCREALGLRPVKPA